MRPALLVAALATIWPLGAASAGDVTVRVCADNVESVTIRVNAYDETDTARMVYASGANIAPGTAIRLTCATPRCLVTYFPPTTVRSDAMANLFGGMGIEAREVKLYEPARHMCLNLTYFDDGSLNAYWPEYKSGCNCIF